MIRRCCTPNGSALLPPAIVIQQAAPAQESVCLVNGEEMILTDDLRREYETRFASIVIKPTRIAEAGAIVSRIADGRARYSAVSAATSVPWHVIGVLHSMESDGRWDCHLANGDPLDRRTLHVPAGRPLKGKPPFTWEESAEDALTFDGLSTWKDWSIAGTLFRVECFNGMGYRMKGAASPYIWAQTQFYQSGKFTRDGFFDRHAVSDQIGAAALYRLLLDRNLILAQNAAEIANQ